MPTQEVKRRPKAKSSTREARTNARSDKKRNKETVEPEKTKPEHPLQPCGLRERKKEQTRQAIEKTILCLVIEKGYEEVTVEEVCEKVGISRKTFFNYFSSKRAAVIGRSYIPSKEMFLKAIETHPDADYVDVITGCIEHGLTAEDASPEIKDLRKAAMLNSPEIFFRSNKSSLVLQPAIMEALYAFFLEHPEKRKIPELSLKEECLLGTSSIICVMRSHIMLSSFKDHPAKISEARSLVKVFLS